MQRQAIETLVDSKLEILWKEATVVQLGIISQRMN
jgi:hypothetical protein